MSTIKDLSKEPPRSPRTRIGGYAILARMIDKGRSTLQGTAGEYHFACPLDEMLLNFKGVTGDDILKLLKSGSDDQAVAQWLDDNGKAANPTEVSEWSDTIETYRPHDDAEKRDWFIGECRPLGLDPSRTTLFDYLDADDKASFGRKVHSP